MTKYKRSRIYLLLSIREINRLSPEQSKQLEQLEKDLLATKPESPKEKCDHDHLCCPGDIKTVRCAYCGKSMYHEPQEELEGFTMDELDRAVEKSIKDGTNPYLKEEELEVEEIDIMELHGKDLHFALKQNELIKAHNALVKEVRK